MFLSESDTESVDAFPFSAGLRLWANNRTFNLQA